MAEAAAENQMREGHPAALEAQNIYQRDNNQVNFLGRARALLEEEGVSKHLSPPQEHPGQKISGDGPYPVAMEIMQEKCTILSRRTRRATESRSKSRSPTSHQIPKQSTKEYRPLCRMLGRGTKVDIWKAWALLVCP
ncbi:hypothetical protein NGA_0176202 [Nannochloropsis gaditana CCMP526]|uniref:uncharacterized protein n=1 Tax=Nannochloropsis gaditana (strain CCMP526) TaxID=1093141 RepID=UPI00029F5073|nr:hypothetical protein NGA_0176202 [Nannochloropsis gaditana CCMP526]XP_005854593.1 hypothetical protein NGA_0176201 [Nannochloropsis gaditana CCMP526]EKU21774.1 hypothetical protein NGA_0176201 [Nannochloropsis gaditana CCMP526]EKU22586.1 hypothetical protein NGA_0176202 [Nannochloropsis gaditana CCMP526]|eukprot:XP_005853776.1 hypothetical protein NGA_0176202 [Nannochloropsis gaditana CCMP526]